MSALDSASKLKDEGNAFFAQRDYQKAYEKYSEAISSMGSGGDKEFKAIVFGNRAACCFGLEK
jgi:septation ring formation regulator EzrA